MRTTVFGKLMVLALATTLFVACQKNEPVLTESPSSVTDAQLKSGKGFVHGIVVEIDGEDYYFLGPPDGPNGEKDVPGQFWRQAGKNKVIGKHYNTGPFETPSWWSSNADDGDYLYIVHGIIDVWSPELAQEYADRGYVHRHEFVKVSDGSFHPSKVIWLKHTAVTSFTLDGGPGAPDPPYAHEVTPGVDWEFPNNYMMPYPED